MTALRELSESDMHREAFERLAFDMDLTIDRWPFPDDNGKDYYKDTQTAWHFWQAALRHRDEQEKLK